MMMMMMMIVSCVAGSHTWCSQIDTDL